MIKTFIVTHEGRIFAIDENNKKLETGVKPIFSFEYETINFDRQGIKKYSFNGSEHELTSNQQIEIIELIDGIVEDVDLTNKISNNADHLMYLRNTDWYIIRHQETGIPVPQEILDARANARSNIIDL